MARELRAGGIVLNVLATAVQLVPNVHAVKIETPKRNGHSRIDRDRELSVTRNPSGSDHSQYGSRSQSLFKASCGIL